MFSVLLVFFTWAVISEAGVIRQPNADVRLHYPPKSRYAVRPTLSTHNAPSKIFQPTLNKYAPVNTNSLPSPVAFNHAAIAPLTVSHISPSLHPQISFGAINPLHTIAHTSLPTVLSFAPLSSSLTSSHIAPSIVLNSAPISYAAIEPLPEIAQITPSVPISDAVLGPALSGSHTSPTLTSYYKIVDVVQEVPKKSVSYSISENAYQYLKRHKSEGQDSPYNPIPGQESASHGERYQNTHSHHSEDKVPTNKPLEDDNVPKSSVLNEDYQGYIEPSFINSPEPLVTKHIYFHVPPPDFEEPAPVPISLPPRKKTYNIMFIKVPAQEQQNYAYLQQLIQSRQAQIEDKTLIYVLSKKQEEGSSPQVVLPPQKTSSPEVYFVKYRTKSADTTEISNEVVEETLLENTSSLLERKQRLGQSASFPEK